MTHPQPNYDEKKVGRAKLWWYWNP